jgi:hypothetical protein
LPSSARWLRGLKGGGRSHPASVWAAVPARPGARPLCGRLLLRYDMRRHAAAATARIPRMRWPAKGSARGPPNQINHSTKRPARRRGRRVGEGRARHSMPRGRNLQGREGALSRFAARPPQQPSKHQKVRIRSLKSGACARRGAAQPRRKARGAAGPCAAAGTRRAGSAQHINAAASGHRAR